MKQLLVLSTANNILDICNIVTLSDNFPTNLNVAPYKTIYFEEK